MSAFLRPHRAECCAPRGAPLPQGARVRAPIGGARQVVDTGGCGSAYQRRLLRPCCDRNCYAWCRSNVERCRQHREAWANKAKADQDRDLFNHLVRTSAPATDGARAKRAFRYQMFGRTFCRTAFQAVWGVGTTRFRALCTAVRKGESGPRMDMRSRKKPLEREARVLPEVMSFLEDLYETEAEYLPEELESVDAPWEEHRSGDGLDLPAEGLGCRAPSAGRELRRLPPGSVKEVWRQFCQAYPAVPCTYQWFRQIWKVEWAHCLKFRTIGQHAQCATCMCHKIVLRRLQGDAVAYAREASVFKEHKEAQYRDRRVYWAIRAEARRLHVHEVDTISLIIDGVDQGKFAYPRHPYYNAKDIEPMQRPRLHVNACLCHGHEVLVTAASADFPKDSNGTCELIGHMLTRLKRKRVAVHRSKLHVQLDNTSSTNKNNIVLGFLAWLVAAGVVLVAEADFLRTGHTHEDVDQFHGQVCSWIKHKPFAETPQDFVRHIQRFLDTLTKKPWPQRAEDRRCVHLNQQRDWKTWLRFLPALKNHTGPRAPHIFRFQRRGCCAPGLLRRTGCQEPVGAPVDDCDAVLFCKQWMADATLSQRPLVVLPAAFVPRTRPPMATARAAITPKLANHLEKYSKLIAMPPYNLVAGGRHIINWVHGRLPLEPPLDVSGVFEPPPAVAAAVAVHAALEDGAHFQVAEVALADAGAAAPAAQPSARAVVVYGVAAALHVHHDIPWADALAVGKRAFKGGAHREAPPARAAKRRRLVPLAADAGPAPALGVQPLDLEPRT